MSEKRRNVTARPKVQILGLTRWSYPFAGRGFRQTKPDLNALRASLYTPQRLNHRLFLLEHVLLPGLRGQTDPDFTHLFLIGEHLPPVWRDAVLSLLKTVPQIIPIIRPEGLGHRDLCRHLLQAHTDQDADAVAQHRLDDDDGLGIRFVEKTRQIFEQMQPVFQSSGQLALDYARGLTLDTSTERLVIKPISMRFWAPGMAVIQRPDTKRSVIDYNHLKIWHRMPTLMWQEEPMFIRGRHADNDSGDVNFGRKSRGFPLKTRDRTRFINSTFGLDLPKMQTSWSRRFEADIPHGMVRPAAIVDQPHGPLTGK